MTKYDHLKQLPVAQRPKNIALNFSKAYYNKSRLVWLVLPLLTFIGNAAAAGMLQPSWWQLLPTVIGSLGIILIYNDLCRGFASSNVGTYFRDTEPMRYWLSILVPCLITTMVAILVWLPPSN